MSPPRCCPALGGTWKGSQGLREDSGLELPRLPPTVATPGGPTSVASFDPRKEADPSAYRIHAGDVYLYGGRTLLNVSRVIVHPNYISPGLGADIALLQLSDSVEGTANVKPVRLSSAQLEVIPEDQCWVTGWGSIGMHGGSAVGAVIPGNSWGAEGGGFREGKGRGHRRRGGVSGLISCPPQPSPREGDLTALPAPRGFSPQSRCRRLTACSRWQCRWWRTASATSCTTTPPSTTSLGRSSRMTCCVRAPRAATPAM